MYCVCLHAGEDFKLESRTEILTFQPDDQQLPVPVTIIEDMIAEQEEQFQLFLSVPIDPLYRIGLQPATDVFIQDDDGNHY